MFSDTKTINLGFVEVVGTIAYSLKTVLAGERSPLYSFPIICVAFKDAVIVSVIFFPSAFQLYRAAKRLLKT